MPVDTETIGLTSGYPLQVFSQGGLAATVIKVTGGDSIYYGANSTVSSSSNTGTLTNGSSLTVTALTYIISAGNSQVTLTNYSGGGDLENAFAAWQRVHAVQGAALADSTSAGAYLHTGPLGTFVAVAGAATGQAAFYLDPAVYPPSVSGRTPKIRLRAWVIANAVAPACTSFVYALVPVATTAGTSGNAPTVATVSAATCSATILTPSATTLTVGTSTAVAFPAAGWFAVQLTVGSGGTAANAQTTHGFELQANRSAP